TDQADDLPRGDGLSGRDETRAVGHVSVQSGDALSADDRVDDNGDPVPVVALGGEADDTACRGEDRVAGGRDHVGAVVPAAERAADVVAGLERVAHLTGSRGGEREVDVAADGGGGRTSGGTRGGRFLGLLLRDLLRRRRRE